jgi:hypothetical protein
MKADGLTLITSKPHYNDKSPKWTKDAIAQVGSSVAKWRPLCDQ